MSVNEKKWERLEKDKVPIIWAAWCRRSGEASLWSWSTLTRACGQWLSNAVVWREAGRCCGMAAAALWPSCGMSNTIESVVESGVWARMSL